MKHRRAIFTLFFAVSLLLAQTSKLTTRTSDAPVYSPWFKDATCGGLRIEVWSDAKGWHEATCMEIATKLSELRDVRSVTVVTGPDVADMLAYPQYEHDFLISREDWNQAQQTCRKVLKGWAAPEVLEHCRNVVAGKVPFGLRVEP